jgi:hypothetical protein
MAPARLRFLCSFLYREHINHTQDFSFCPLLFPPVHSPPLSVTCVLQYCCICARSIIHIWERTCNFGPSEPGWLHLRWCSPVPSIYLRKTEFHSSSWLSKTPLKHVPYVSSLPTCFFPLIKNLLEFVNWSLNPSMHLTFSCFLEDMNFLLPAWWNLHFFFSYAF